MYYSDTILKSLMSTLVYINICILFIISRLTLVNAFVHLKYQSMPYVYLYVLEIFYAAFAVSVFLA